MSPSAPDLRPIHGRDDVIAALRGSISSLELGNGGVVHISGESGSGKSALLEFASGFAQHSELSFAFVRCGAKRESDVASSLATALERLTPPLITSQLARRIESEPALRYGWLQDLEESFDSYPHPLVILIDDLQFADDVTRLAARVLPKRLRRRPVLWIFAERTEPQDRNADIDRTEVVSFALARLDDDAVNALATDILGGSPDPEVAGLMRVANGLPLYAVSQARRLRDSNSIGLVGGVASIRDDAVSVKQEPDNPISVRLEGLSTEAQQTVSAAALLGMQFTLGDLASLVEAVPGRLVGPLLELTAASVLHDASRVFEFEHELVRRAAEQRLEPDRGRQLRRKAFEIACRDGEPSTIAAHALSAARVDESDASQLDSSLLILDQALQAIAGRDAESAAQVMLRRIELLPPDSPQAPLDVAAVVPVLLHAGRAPEARLLARRGIPSDVDPDTAMNGYLALAQLATLDDPSVAREILDTARALKGLSLVSRARLEAVSLRPFTSEYAYQELEAALPAARDIIGRADDVVARTILAHVETIAAFHRLEWDSAMEAIDAASDSDSPEGWFQALIRISLMRNGGWAEQALFAIGREIRSADEQNESFALLHFQLVRSNILLDLGRLDDATIQAEALLELAEELDLLWSVEVGAVAILAQVALQRHMPGALSRLSPAVERFLRDPVGYQRATGRWIQLLLSDIMGDSSMAEALTGAPYERSRILGPPVGGASDPLDDVYFVRTVLALGHPERAREVVEIVDKRLSMSTAQIAPAIHAHVHGIVEQDQDLLRTAAERYASIGWPLAEASAWEDLGLAAAGSDPSLALEALTQAHRLLNDSEATRALVRVEKRIRELGGGTLTRAGTRNELGLTVAEQRIVDRVLMNESTAEIASALYLSRNTVGAHLRRIYATLGVRSRSELTAKLQASSARGSGVHA